MIYRIYTVDAGSLRKWGTAKTHGHQTLKEAKVTLLIHKTKFPERYIKQQFVIQEYQDKYKAKIIYVSPEIKIINNDTRSNRT